MQYFLKAYFTWQMCFCSCFTRLLQRLVEKSLIYTWYFGLNESLMALSLTWLSLASQVAHALNAYSYLLKKIKKWWLGWLSNLHCFRWKCLIQSRVMITNFIHSQYDSKSKYYSPPLCYKSSFKAFIRQLHYAIVY
jgi:hypothetical protein